MLLVVPSSYWVVPEQELRSWQVSAQRLQEVQLPAWESSLIPDTKHLENEECLRRDSRACRAMKGKYCRAWKHQEAKWSWTIYTRPLATMGSFLRHRHWSGGLTGHQFESELSILGCCEEWGSKHIFGDLLMHFT